MGDPLYAKYKAHMAEADRLAAKANRELVWGLGMLAGFLLVGLGLFTLTL